MPSRATTSESIEGPIDMSDHRNPDHSPPRPIQIAVIGMWVGAAMSMIYVFVWYLEVRTLNAKSTAALEEKYGDQLISADSLMNAGMVFSLGLNAVAALIAVAIWVSMAIANGRGVAWARIVATALGTIGLVNTGFAASAAYAEDIMIPTSAIYYAADFLLVVAIIALLWIPASTVFYTDSSTRRRQERDTL
jgi:hypothetical protein